MDSTEDNTLTIRPGRVTLVLGLVSAFLLVVSVITQVIAHEYQVHYGGLVRIFDLNAEGNLPTLFSAMILLFASFLLFLIGAAKKKEKAAFALHWTVLAIIFLYLALDEAGGIHELTISPLRKWLGTTGGVFHFAWVIPAMALLIVFAVAYFRFVMQLTMKYRILFVVAGTAFVAGAVGMEMVGARYFAAVHGRRDLIYLAITTVEEALEMGGIILFIHALLAYMRSNLPDIRFTIGRRRRSKPRRRLK